MAGPGVGQSVDVLQEAEAVEVVDGRGQRLVPVDHHDDERTVGVGAGADAADQPAHTGSIVCRHHRADVGELGQVGQVAGPGDDVDVEHRRRPAPGQAEHGRAHCGGAP